MNGDLVISYFIPGNVHLVVPVTGHCHSVYKRRIIVHCYKVGQQWQRWQSFARARLDRQLKLSVLTAGIKVIFINSIDIV